MIEKSESNGYLFNNLETMLEQSQPLFRLAKQIPLSLLFLFQNISNNLKNLFLRIN